MTTIPQILMANRTYKRDSKGRFASGGSGGGGLADDVEFESNVKGVKFSPEDQQRIKDSISRCYEALGDNAPAVTKVIIDDDAPHGTVTGQAIRLNSNLTTRQGQKEMTDEWQGEMVGGGTLEGVVIHEYGHLAEQQLSVRNPRKHQQLMSYAEGKYESDDLKGRTMWAMDSPEEWIAEAFSDNVVNGSKATSSSKTLLRKLRL